MNRLIQEYKSKSRAKQELMDLLNQKDSHDRSIFEICKAAKFIKCEAILNSSLKLVN